MFFLPFDGIKSNSRIQSIVGTKYDVNMPVIIIVCLHKFAIDFYEY